MKHTRHDHEQQRSRFSGLEEMPLEQTERELTQLLAPLGRRNASPQLNSRLREMLRETGSKITREASRNIISRWLNRKLLIPLPLAAAAVTLILTLASWVTVLEIN